MGTYTVKTYLRKLQRMRKELNSVQRRCPYLAANYMSNQARMMVPISTGRLRSSIRYWKTKEGASVYCGAPGNGGFPYAKWINQSPGFESINYPNGGSFYHLLYGRKIRIPKDSSIIYGQAFRQWDFKGTPKFWDIATQRTARFFRQEAINGLKRVIRG